MKVYVTGAGASKDAGYPLGPSLFQEMDSFVRGSGSLVRGFDYSKDWPATCEWLEKNESLVVRESYRRRNLEGIFSALDFVDQVREESTDQYYLESRKLNPDPQAAIEAEDNWKVVGSAAADSVNARRILLLALTHYLEQKHYDDQRACVEEEWDYLRTFGNKLCEGDVVITFNYDSSLERVLYLQRKWYPSDGYGFRLRFQKAQQDETPLEFPDSPVKILHLHGAIGWYQVATFLGSLIDGMPTAQFGLDPIFLARMGISGVDASMPFRRPQGEQILIHPSYIKNYEWAGGGGHLFIAIWKQAARYLQCADEIFIIGYSLPSADTAALTLFLTSCNRRVVRVINPDRITRFRLKRILDPNIVAGRPANFKSWLLTVKDCDR